MSDHDPRLDPELRDLLLQHQRRGASVQEREPGLVDRLLAALFPVVEKLPPHQEDPALPEVITVHVTRRLQWRELARLVVWPVVVVEVRIEADQEITHHRAAVAVNVQRPQVGAR